MDDEMESMRFRCVSWR